tara:strand:+ start:326 stop:490 length:165 start_codon:yes stop_codon:yes gene_type:complete
MIVRELIEELKQLDSEKDVMVWHQFLDDNYPVKGVEMDKISDIPYEDWDVYIKI